MSFGASPPFLMQHISGHYTNIHFETAGNQIRQAEGMKVNVVIKDVRLEDTATSSGSIGSLVANITWSSQGIKDTIQNAIPIVGSFVTGVTTNPSAGTIELQGSAGQHHRKAGGRRQRDLPAGDGIAPDSASRCRGRLCSLRWTRSPRS